MTDNVTQAIEHSDKLDEAAKKMLTNAYLTLVRLCQEGPDLKVVR